MDTSLPEPGSHIGVSVVIPLYNKERHVARAVQSVLDQTYGDLEVIVVDDGSTDGGADVVEAIHDPRVKLIRQENAGVSAARNRGIAEARAELLAFLDADDEWLPGFLETILRLNRSCPECGAYATAYDVVKMDGARRTRDLKGLPAPPWEGVIPNFFRCSPVPLWISAAAVPRRVFDAVGVFPVGIQPGEDNDLWCRIAVRYPIAFSNQVGAVYHMEAENRALRRQRHETPLSPIVETLDKALKSGILPAGVNRDDIVEFKNKRHIFNAWVLICAGNPAEARVHLRAAASTRRFREARRVWYLYFRSLVPPRLSNWFRRVGRRFVSTPGRR